jgi:collagenase-like PrtC family protease
MLKFSVATNWDDNLINEIEILDQELKVSEVFGKLARDFVGGGRPAYALNEVSRRRAAGHIKLIQKTGRKFNYLLNATCLDNREFTRSGQREIRKLLSWLDSFGVDGITVANPYLGYLIKKEYPQFELSVSSYSAVDSIRKTKFWIEEIGANKITLRPSTMTRNFPLLRKIRSQTNGELQLLATQLCQYDCPLGIYHANFVSHASQDCHSLRGFGIDWCLINCRYKLLTHPEELIKASWIRPEDVVVYENIGIDSIKITDRVRTTQQIIFVLKPYLENKFDGNLADLLFSTTASNLTERKLILKGLRFFFHPLHVNVFKLAKLKGLFSEIKIYIDNRKLDGFLDYFLEGKCKHDDCQKCGYCRNVAERAVKIDNAYKEKIDKNFKKIIESLTNGDMFRYF